MVARPKKKGTYPKAQKGIEEKKEKILFWLSRSLSRGGACAKAGCSWTQFRKYVNEDPVFAQNVVDAEELGTNVLEDIATSRAKRKSDILLMFMLKKRNPAYRDKQEVNVLPVEVRVKRFSK